ncbi:MAG: hypothetical protein K8J08_10755 [Thermoanaerobaculia bacterium]|nr:hypothetical protein [Thermoanaerobaculia bacterium]
MTNGQTHSPRSIRIVRVAIGAMVALLAVTAIVRFLERRSSLAEVTHHWTESGIAARHPKAFATAQRASDPRRARLGLARALLADSLDVARLSDLAPDQALLEAGRIEGRLSLAASLARSVGNDEPSSWEVPTVIGGVALLEQLINGLDEGRAASSWEQPLQRARELSPTAVEPVRFLVASSLSRWHTLSDEERKETQLLLQRSLEDAGSLLLLLPGWMAIASPEQLFSSLPDSSNAWAQVNSELVRQGRWEAYCQGREGWRDRVGVELNEALAEADARRIGGDVAGARRLYLQVLSTATPSLDQAALFSQALANMPPGPIGDRLGSSFQAWLDWALPLWILDRPSLPTATYQRLASFSAFLEPASVAVAELAAGDLERATNLELRSDESWSEEWGLYYLAKTHFLVALGRHKDAVNALDKVHRNHRQGPVYRRLRRALGFTGVPEMKGTQNLQSWSQPSWSSTDWVWHGAELSLIVDDPVMDDDAEPTPRKIEIHLDELRPERAPIEIQWDGRSQGCWLVGDQGTLPLEVSLTPGLHRLVVTAPTRAQVKPGTVRLGGYRRISPDVSGPAPSKR